MTLWRCITCGTYRTIPRKEKGKIREGAFSCDSLYSSSGCLQPADKFSAVPSEIFAKKGKGTAKDVQDCFLRLTQKFPADKLQKIFGNSFKFPTLPVGMLHLGEIQKRIFCMQSSLLPSLRDPKHWKAAELEPESPATPEAVLQHLRDFDLSVSWDEVEKQFRTPFVTSLYDTVIEVRTACWEETPPLQPVPPKLKRQRVFQVSDPVIKEEVSEEPCDLKQGCVSDSEEDDETPFVLPWEKKEQCVLSKKTWKKPRSPVLGTPYMASEEPVIPLKSVGGQPATLKTAAEMKQAQHQYKKKHLEKQAMQKAGGRDKLYSELLEAQKTASDAQEKFLKLSAQWILAQKPKADQSPK